MEWQKIQPECFEQYKDGDKYLIIIYHFSDIALCCSSSLVYWSDTYNEWTNAHGYPAWIDNELYEDYTHYIVIEKPVTQ